jgi:hypothetical protein
VARQIVAIFDWLYVGAIKATLKDAQIQIIDSCVGVDFSSWNLAFKRLATNCIKRTVI